MHVPYNIDGMYVPTSSFLLLVAVIILSVSVYTDSCCLNALLLFACRPFLLHFPLFHLSLLTNYSYLLLRTTSYRIDWGKLTQPRMRSIANAAVQIMRSVFVVTVH